MMVLGYTLRRDDRGGTNEGGGGGEARPEHQGTELEGQRGRERGGERESVRTGRSELDLTELYEAVGSVTAAARNSGLDHLGGGEGRSAPP